MPNAIGKITTTATPKKFLDMSRPLMMVNADKVYKVLTAKEDKTATATLTMTGQLSSLLKGIKSFEIDTLWTKVEKSFNSGKKIATTAKTTADDTQTAFSLFYSMLNAIDIQAEGTAGLKAFRTMYLEARNHVEGRFVGKFTGKDKRMLERIIRTVDSRLDEVIENFNLRVQAGNLRGPQIAT